MSTTRKLIPVIFFGALTVAAGACGFYQLCLCLRDLLAASSAAWGHFLGAELLLLFGWSFLLWTRIALAIYRGRVQNAQVRIRSGVVGRIFFMIAAGIFGVGYTVTKMFDMPWWFTHFAHAVFAVLLFGAFTFPWSRSQRAALNT
jgi:hypothetical protein